MIDSPLITLIGIAIIGIVFALLFIAPTRRSKDESGLSPLYEEKCSGKKVLGWGFSAGGNIPNWRISFYEDFFVIASLGPITVVPYAEVESVEYGRQTISTGLRIRIHTPQMEFVLFPNGPQKMLELFRKKNAPVAG